MTRRSHGIVLATLGIASLSWPALAQQDKIGVAAEVNPDVFAQVPEGQKRELLVGHDVIHNEKINTGNGGQAQLLFTDQSTLTVAKNSEVVIDDFVFDPQKQNGNLTATLTTGVFRYVGGKISKQQDVTFLTPTGTVSVRGGIALIKIDGDTITAVFLHGDYLKVTSHGVSQTTNHRNTVIISVGGHVSDPTTASAELIQELTQELQALHLTTYTVANEIFVTGDTLASLINLILPIVPNAISTEPNFIPHSPPPPPLADLSPPPPPPSSPPPPPPSSPPPPPSSPPPPPPSSPPPPPSSPPPPPSSPPPPHAHHHHDGDDDDHKHAHHHRHHHGDDHEYCHDEHGHHHHHDGDEDDHKYARHHHHGHDGDDDDHKYVHDEHGHHHDHDRWAWHDKDDEHGHHHDHDKWAWHDKDDEHGHHHDHDKWAWHDKDDGHGHRTRSRQVGVARQGRGTPITGRITGRGMTTTTPKVPLVWS